MVTNGYKLYQIKLKIKLRLPCLSKFLARFRNSILKFPLSTKSTTDKKHKRLQKWDAPTVRRLLQTGFDDYFFIHRKNTATWRTRGVCMGLKILIRPNMVQIQFTSHHLRYDFFDWLRIFDNFALLT